MVLTVKTLFKALDAGNICLKFMNGFFGSHMSVIVAHHSPARPKDCLHDDQVIDVGDLDRVDGGNISS